jgi:hypothetical protein
MMKIDDDNCAASTALARRYFFVDICKNIDYNLIIG